MKQFGLFIFWGISLAISAYGQNARDIEADSLYLNIIIPEQDTVIYSYHRYRVAANTHPDAKAYINGKEVKVYASGAFVDLIDHDDDITSIEFKVVLNNLSLLDTLYLKQPESKEPDFDNEVISNLMVEPKSDIWLESGEVLNVQFQGKPGEEAFFSIDGFTDNIKMEEISPRRVDDKEGVYRGSYFVQPGDNAKDRTVTFKIKKGLLGYHKRTSKFKVTFLAKPLIGNVIAEDAYLNIGLGTDRLGGAKYGNIQKGVQLKIVGKQKGFYKVRLSESLDAWIPTRFVEITDEEPKTLSSLTGNIRVSGNSKYDLIRVTLSDKLPYITYQELDPNKIIVDVFGATSNTNWKIKYLSSEGISNVDWRQVENDRFRLIIELNNPQNWGYEIGYGWGSILDIKLKRSPVIKNPEKPLEGRTIAIDAGHGGDNNGSLGAAGFQEKQVTLEISEILRTQLIDAGAKVIMTRTDDSYLFMAERKDIVINNDAELLVSVHANSIGYGSDPETIEGTGAFYKHIAFKPLAEAMYKQMTKLGLKDYGLTGNFNFSLNAPIEFPNVLVETAFISNPNEEILLTDPEFQSKIAAGIVEGLKEFYLNYALIEKQ